MLSDIIDAVHKRRVNKCTQNHTGDYKTRQFLCELLHIRRVKYNSFLFSLDMFYLMAKEPKNAKQYYRKWIDTLKDPYFKD